MPRLGRRLLPFSAAATPLQAVTYLVGVSLFSISFLVFLNSAVSFVVTDLLGRKHGVGDVVGTLGFVDEVVALVACPLWGLASDRLGVRWVAVLGYAVIAVALVAFVQARDVPALVAGRVLFALGASAAATMVTAALPILTGGADGADGDGAGAKRNIASQRRGELPDADQDGGADDVDDEETLVGNGYESAEGRRGHQTRGSVAVSLESDATITPETFTARQGSSSSASSGEGSRVAAGDGSGSTEDEAARRSSALAGYVGLFTGCGALVALVLFLPLPTRFSHREGVTPADAIAYSFYVVAGVALLVAIFVFLGFAGLPGEDAKGWRMLLGLRSGNTSGPEQATEHRDQGNDSSDVVGPVDAPLPYTHLLRTSLRLGLTDPDIALGYLGGFVARASTVAISLFVPLYVNAYYISHGFCRAPPEHDGNPVANDPDFKRECRAAYVLASALTGAAQLVALLCAPAFGYLGGSRRRRRVSLAPSWTASSSSYTVVDRLRRVNFAVPFAAGVGVVGYAAFPRLPSPEFRDEDGRGGSPAVFAVVALLGLSQIGAIVCSLGSLGRGVLAQGDGCPALTANNGDRDPATHRHEYGDGDAEAEPLIHDRDDDAEREMERAGRRPRASRVQLKGSIAGVYSLCGGAAILLLTKLGGFLFDVTSTGAPFYMMAAFNAVLFVASLAVDLFGRRR